MRESPIVNEPLFSVLCLNTFLLLPVTGMAAFSVRRCLGTPERPASPLRVGGGLAVALATLAAAAALVAFLLAGIDGRPLQPQRAALLVANVAVAWVIGRTLEQILRAVARLRDIPVRPDIRQALDDWRMRESLSGLGWSALLLPAWMIILASGVLLVPALLAVCLLLTIGMIARFDSIRRLGLLTALARSLSRRGAAANMPGGVGGGLESDSRLLKLLQQLESGAGLAEAVASVDRLVPPAVAREVAVAQATGRVVEVLQRNTRRELAGLDETTRLGTLTWLLMYLSAVATVTVGVVTFLSFFVVPKLKKIWSDFGVDVAHSVPQMVLDAIDHSEIYMIAAAPLTFFPVLSTVWALGQQVRIRPLASSPPPSSRAAPAQTPELLRILALLIESQLPLPDGLQELARYESQPYDRERWLLLAEGIAAGLSPWDLLRELKLLSEAQAGFLRSAERLQNLPWALRQLADTIERRRGVRLQRFAELALPAFVVLVGAWVLLFAAVVFQPACSLIQRLAQSIR